MSMLRDPTTNKNEDQQLKYLVKKFSEKPLTPNQRNDLVIFYIEEHFRVRGLKPSDNQLQCLSDFLLVDELKDKSPDKLTNTEFPFLSTKQLKRRTNREQLSVITNIDWFHFKSRSK